MGFQSCSIKTRVSADVKFKPSPPTALSNYKGFNARFYFLKLAFVKCEKIVPCVVSSKASIVGSELKAFTISKRFSGSTDPSNLKYATLIDKRNKQLNHLMQMKWAIV